MLGLYTPLLILQAICLYHAYRTNAEQRWYWLIIFIPLVGCALYIAHTISGRNVQTLTQSIRQVVNSNYRIEHLEKQLRFVDNVANKINLADAYMAVERFADALALYQQCLNDMFMTDDDSLQMKALQAAYGSGNMELAIHYGTALENKKKLQKRRGAHSLRLGVPPHRPNRKSRNHIQGPRQAVHQLPSPCGIWQTAGGNKRHRKPPCPDKRTAG
jgi:hypothetical protein